MQELRGEVRKLFMHFPPISLHCIEVSSYDCCHQVSHFKAKLHQIRFRLGLHRICVAIWETGEWPEEWTFSTFIPLPKKGDLKQCANYRTIRLATAPGEKLLPVGRRSLSNWTRRAIPNLLLCRKLHFVLRKINKNCCHQNCTF